MNICIIGSGASGWIICTALKKLNFIKKITIIGSSKIPSIGVGESTTLSFDNFLIDNNISLKNFVRETDATIKYGVYYKNWSEKEFIHLFQNKLLYEIGYNIKYHEYANFLSNKDKKTHIHDLIGNNLWNIIKQNKVALYKDAYLHSWHFDANKFINFLKKENLKNKKVEYIDDKIIDCKFLGENFIDHVVGENNKKYNADYFINCLGDTFLNEKIFKINYKSLSSYLLTNKALVYPLKYQDKKNQFHPYTIAKTMKNGWRWITPTQSRIGTGYVFSNNHISIDEATNEFLEDIGDKTIKPILVDFNPKFNPQIFKENSCTIGMSAGFLEPLDAPGLDITLKLLKDLEIYLKNKCENNVKYSLDSLNGYAERHHQMPWCCFILHQYKTCWRNDTKFWIDHKNVNFSIYDDLINDFLLKDTDFPFGEKMMFAFTAAAKDIQWNCNNIKESPFPIVELDYTDTIHHLDYIQSFYD